MIEKNVKHLEHAEFAALSAELIENSGGLRFRAHGRSMLPTILNGDILIVEKTDPSKLCVGNVVMFKNGSDSLLAHRIIKQKNNIWTTCGDALYTHDEPFAAEQLIGIVRCIEHNGVKKQLSRSKGRVMAAISRHSTSLIGRILKRLLRS